MPVLMVKPETETHEVAASNPKASAFLALTIALGAEQGEARRIVVSTIGMMKTLVHLNPNGTAFTELGRFFAPFSAEEKAHAVGTRVFQMICAKPGSDPFTRLPEFLEARFSAELKDQYEALLKAFTSLAD